MKDLTPDEYRQLIRDIFSGLNCLPCGINDLIDDETYRLAMEQIHGPNWNE